MKQYSNYFRLAAGIPKCSVADVMANATSIAEVWQQAEAVGASLVVFPELCLTGYTIKDLFADRALIGETYKGLEALVKISKSVECAALIGLPVEAEDTLMNCAAFIQGGKLLGLVPKSYLPNYREFEEARWFHSGRDLSISKWFGPIRAPIGTDLLFSSNGVVIGVEICEDLWVQVPPSVYQVSAGANIICNLSASNFTIGKADIRRMLVRSSSDRGKCAYLYVAAGPGESSTDLSFDADAFIYENGSCLVESERFSRSNQLIYTDIDMEALIHDRLITGTFGDCSSYNRREFRYIPFKSRKVVEKLARKISKHPFIPSNPDTLAERCWETFEIQSNALATRLQATGSENIILGLSGGLDSTQAALVCVNALDLLNKSRKSLVCVTMPGLGTTKETKSNAVKLADALGATLREISIGELSRAVLSAIGHDAGKANNIMELMDNLKKRPELADLTLENIQARLRTLILMSIANQMGGFVVGTGDLSEKALGWSTYAGDHISMYDINSGIPKTLIQFVIRWAANERVEKWGNKELRKILFDIINTPISPELLPADGGKIAQLTEEKIGPYELHDFYLYHFIRHGRTPTQILELAEVAFSERGLVDLKKWLTVFYKRFFTNQFKRSCTADGPKVGMVALSPRGDWRMPSDARVKLWLNEIERYK